MKKHVGINMSHYNIMGGYGVVATNIINELLKLDNYEFYLFNNKDFSLSDEYNNKKNIHKIITKQENYMFYRLFTQGNLIKKYNIQTFYTPDQIVPLKKYCKYISTIHDLFDYEKYSGLRAFNYFYTMGFKGGFRVFLYHVLPLDKIFAKKSDYIVTPSTNSKNDIIRLLDVNPNNIIVSYWGIDHMKDYNHYDDKKEYILFPLCDCYFSDYLAFRIGKEIIKKNLISNVYYWKPGGGKYDFFKQFEKEKGFIILNKRLTEEEKYNLIKNAKCCIYLSRFEGFGFVPLEVLKIGTPLIYHKIGSLEEVIGDAGIGISSSNIHDYISCLINILDNSDYGDKLIENGKKRSQKFVWRKTIENFIDKI